MTDETLLSLEELETDTRTDEEKKPYDLRIVEKELVLCCALILAAPDLIEPDGLTTEIKNENFLRFWRPYYLHCHRRNMQSIPSGIQNPYLGEEPLPDVCGWCFRTVGFCLGSRVRFHCRECYSPAIAYNAGRLSISRRYYPNRICSSGHAEPILAQLIYKYFSSNGDRSWVMKTVFKS